MSCDYIGMIASGIWSDIGEPTSLSPSFISGTIVSPTYIGQLNNSLNTCYSGVSGCIEPALGYEEAAVLAELYKIGFYSRQIASVSNMSLVDSWTTLKDDVSSITRQNKTEIAKVWVSMRNASNGTLNDMIWRYQQNNTHVGVIDMANNNEINPFARSSMSAWWGGDRGRAY